jgi:hypothetical protein
MRAFQIMMFVFCLIGGVYLLLAAPEFFLPERDTPALGRQFGPLATRTLGAGLLAIAALAMMFLRHHFAEPRRDPGSTMQKIYFALIVLALGLVSLSLNLAEPMTAPGERPEAGETP